MRREMVKSSIADGPEVIIHVCADCPCCASTMSTDDFHCDHPRRPDTQEAIEPLRIFDRIPDWCPIRSAVLRVVVSP